jgi:hypothetical protein
MVKLNITFSQPLFSELTTDIILERDSVSPFDWRKMRVANIRERMIWMIIKVVFIF